MSHYLTSVQFCYNDDPENFQSKTIDISKDVRSIWDGLSYSVYDLEDVGDKFMWKNSNKGVSYSISWKKISLMKLTIGLNIPKNWKVLNIF